jgi:hypothetical protein
MALVALILCCQSPAGAIAPVAFDELDRNGDNRLSSREAQRIRIRGFDFANADRNRDGYVSKVEFDSAVRITRNA